MEGVASEALSIFIDSSARDLNIRENYLHQCAKFLDEGLSVPFIVRYRSVQVGKMDGSQAHLFEENLKKHQSLSNTRMKVLKAAEDCGSLTRDLRRHILSAHSASELDDLYQPFKPPSKGTLAERASQIPGLAEVITSFVQNGNDEALFDLISKDSKLKDSCMVLLSSYVSKLPEILSEMKSVFKSRSVLTSKRAPSSASSSSDKSQKHKSEEMTTAADHTFGSLSTYENFSISMRQLKPHQTLALSRFKDKNLLTVSIVLEEKELGDRVVLKQVHFSLSFVKFFAKSDMLDINSSCVCVFE
jgi:protein Tex